MVTGKTLSKTFVVAASLFIAALTLYAQAPKGWFLAGSKPASYNTGVDSANMYSGMPSAYLRSKEPHVAEGFGTLMQEVSPKDYLGKRVRFGAFVKSDSIENWAGLWMRVDDTVNPKVPLAFDNMQNRPIQGTGGWKEYEVVLDVPPTAADIAFGILLAGGGSTWISGVTLTEVGTNVPTTGTGPLQAPANLDFTK